MPPLADPDELFELFYNNGRRRTYREVADATGLSYITVRRYADDADWDARADAIDEEVRAQTMKRLANDVAKQNVRNVQVLSTLLTKFAARLVPSTDGRPNPAEILPGDIDIDDFTQLVKTWQLVTGGATERVGQEGASSALDDMARSIAEMDEKERQPALPAGGGAA